MVLCGAGLFTQVRWVVEVRTKSVVWYLEGKAEGETKIAKRRYVCENRDARNIGYSAPKTRFLAGVLMGAPPVTGWQESAARPSRQGPEVRSTLT